MWRIQKFSPRNCPHCGHQFNQSDKDWLIYLGTIENGKKVIDPEGPRIICNNCDQLVKITKEEEYQLLDKEKAEELMATQGFFDLQEVEAVGNMARDMHYKHTGESKPQVWYLLLEAQQYVPKILIDCTQWGGNTQLTPEEAGELYSDLLETFTGRKPKE